MYINAHMVIVLWILAIFGLYYLVIKGFYGSIRPLKRSKAKLSIIISARNQQDTIEGIVREFMMKTKLGKDEDAFMEIVLVDNGSSDHTTEIIKKMSRDFGFQEFTSTESVNGFKT